MQLRYLLGLAGESVKQSCNSAPLAVLLTVVQENAGARSDVMTRSFGWQYAAAGWA
jgi:hypothetical protein